MGAAGEAALEPVPEPPGLKEAVGPRHQEMVGVGLLPALEGLGDRAGVVPGPWAVSRCVCGRLGATLTPYFVR